MSKIKGYIYGSISAATYGLVPLFSLPIMANNVPINTILFYRFLIASLAIALIMIYKKISFRVSLKEIFTLSILRVLFSLCAIFSLIIYVYMPAVVATTILFLYPLFLSIIIALFFNEKLNNITRVFMLVSMVGM